MIDPVQTLKIFQRQPEPQTVPAGQVIFEQGQPADRMYGILAGEVDILVNDRVVETVQPGEVFGTGALIEIKERSYSAVAKTDCKLAFLDRNRFLFAVQETPVFALEVMKSYSDRLLRIAHTL